MTPREKKWVEEYKKGSLHPFEKKFISIIEKQERMLEHIKNVLRNGKIISKLDYVYILFKELDEMER